MICLSRIIANDHFNHVESPQSSPDLTGWAIQLCLGNQLRVFPMKKLFLIPMAVCWLYFYSMVVVLFLILLAILGSVFVPNDVLTRLLGVLATLGDAGFVGLIFLVISVGQYYLVYRLYLYFKTKAA